MGLDAADLSCQRYRGPVVAAAVRDHAARRLLFGQREDGIDRPSELEGSNALEDLGLEMKVPPLAAAEHVHCSRGENLSTRRRVAEVVAAAVIMAVAVAVAWRWRGGGDSRAMRRAAL